jgi:AsmA protein
MLNADLNITGPTNKLVTTGSVGLFNGKLAGFDLGSKMSAIATLAGVKTGKDLDIEKITSNLHMAPDGLRADNFQAVLPAVGNLVGAGTIDSKNTLDFKMAATLATSSIAGSAASPVSATAGLLGKLSGGGCKTTTSPFLIAGTTADPKFVPDVGGIASSMLKSQLGCAGGITTGASQQQQQNPNNPIDALSGLFKKKKP